MSITHPVPEGAKSASSVTMHERIRAVLDDVWSELERAYAKHKPMNSAHEAYAVILEEVDELWDDVKADRGYLANYGHKEALQIAAMACRYLIDLRRDDR